MFKRALTHAALALTAVLALNACQPQAAVSSTAPSTDLKNITLGFGVGTYIDQVRYGVVPELEKKGYHVTLRQFTQGVQINPALDEGAIQASVFQTPAYMESYNHKQKSDIIAIAVNPSPPQTLRSKKHASINEIRNGMSIAIANDPINAERGARILEKLGWIRIKDGVNPLDFSVNDISAGKYQLNIKQADSAQGMRLLDDVDYAVINGNFVASSGEKIADGLVIEDTPPRHRVNLTIKAQNQHSAWAQDLVAAFESKAYADYIRSQSQYADFIEPAVWQKYPVAPTSEKKHR
ncbi:MetQ/NlpA family ABC transporter substrate-binding protein [Vitreoscilla massiliensis]|uniref:MetQ/NlpA family ABC transporter substrate-binding protein n=1 Tax=Vitreoscilla massiliensis TaxID=1689272 RepID=A0ABY4DZT0_9NEIS|nr:MetQ/NlpA family ABC transporter substrate-binding protein [Vitreoscilla massiliensis]UOO89049.1 MetQ/NlpA family ABC transporter substrate-binding protein [Vitreoscilla massiliensis]